MLISLSLLRERHEDAKKDPSLLIPKDTGTITHTSPPPRRLSDNGKERDSGRFSDGGRGSSPVTSSTNLRSSMSPNRQALSPTPSSSHIDAKGIKSPVDKKGIDGARKIS